MLTRPIILVILDDLVIFGIKPIDIRSIPIANIVMERRYTIRSRSNPGFNISAMDKDITMIPIITCKILIPLEIFLSYEVIAANIQKY